MQESERCGFSGWTENGLRQQIVELKSGRDMAGLKAFLGERIDDEDPCCRTNRTKLWNELGLAWLEDNPGEAERCFSETLKLDPLNQSAVYNLANLAFHQGAFDKAIGLFERVICIDGNDFSALFNQALCHLYSGQSEPAQARFVRAAELQPDHHGANYWAGETFLQGRAYAEALPYFEQAYALKANHFETINGYAMALQGAGDYEQAISICDNSLAVLGPSVVSLRTKADALLGLERVEEAVLCHLDIAHIDLDARDSIVSCLQLLYRENRDRFERYRDFMLERAPDFEPLQAVIRQFEDADDTEEGSCHQSHSGVEQRKD